MAELNPSLLAEIRRDLRPVRPLLPPGARSIAVFALAGVIGTLFLLSVGIRDDLDQLGTAFSMLLALRLILGVTLIAVAFREAVPASAVPRIFANEAIAFATVLLIVLPFSMARRAEGIPLEFPQIRCFLSELIIALPAFAVSYWLIARAYPLRPFVAATAAAVGVGLIADAALFVHCEIDQPIHVAVTHEGAVLFVAIIGGTFGWLLGRRRWHKLPSSG